MSKGGRGGGGRAISGWRLESADWRNSRTSQSFLQFIENLGRFGGQLAQFLMGGLREKSETMRKADQIFDLSSGTIRDFEESNLLGFRVPRTSLHDI